MLGFIDGEKTKIMATEKHDAVPATHDGINTDENSNAVKDPDTWATGEEPMTGAQKSYLKTLSDQANEPFDDTLNKADASKRIDELQEKTGRGK